MVDSAPGSSEVTGVLAQGVPYNPVDGLRLMNVAEVVKSGAVLEQIFEDGRRSLLSATNHVSLELRHGRWHVRAENLHRPEG